MRWRSGRHSVRESLADHLHPGPVKIIIQTATGSLSPPQAELNRLALEVHGSGLQLAFHVDEADTLEAAMTALEHALSRAPRAGPSPPDRALLCLPAAI